MSRTIPDTGAKAEIIDGMIVISVAVDALPIIVSGSCAARNLTGLWKVTDAELFAFEVVATLNHEKEDGTTMIHEMFDGAFDRSIDLGAEGIDKVDEEAFEAEAARLQEARADA